MRAGGRALCRDGQKSLAAWTGMLDAGGSTRWPSPREALFEQVWSEPMTKVAARHGVSSNFLARVCERLNVPRPGRGYWQQLEVGKAEPKPTLPEARPGDELEWAREGEPRRFFQPAAPSVDERQPPSKRVFAAGTIHPIVAGTRDIFSQSTANDAGHLRPSKRKLPDIFVTKKQLERGLGFLDELFKALESRGHRVDFAPFARQFQRPDLEVRENRKGQHIFWQGWSPDRPTVTYVQSVAFGLTLFEPTEEVEVRYLDGKYVRVSDLPPRPPRRGYPTSSWTTTRDMATGRLALRATSPYWRAPWEQQWRESKPGSLPGKVSEIVRTLEGEAPGLAERVAEGEQQAERERLEAEERHRRWQAEERERRRLERIKQSREELLKAIDSFRYAQGFESFFADVERRAAELPSPEQIEILKKVGRARALLGGVNALERFAQWVPPSAHADKPAEGDEDE
jgi:hypothetical protein